MLKNQIAVSDVENMEEGIKVLLKTWRKVLLQTAALQHAAGPVLLLWGVPEPALGIKGGSRGRHRPPFVWTGETMLVFRIWFLEAAINTCVVVVVVVVVVFVVVVARNAKPGQNQPPFGMRITPL